MRTPKTPLLLGAGLLSAGLLGLTGTGTLSAVMAQVVTNPNTVGLGRMVLELRSDVKGADTCSSAEDLTDVLVCKTIQPLSGRTDLLPGEAVTTTITAVNRGTVTPSTFTLTSDRCTATGSPVDDDGKKAAESICGQVQVVVAVDHEAVWKGTARELAKQNFSLRVPDRDESEDVTFTTSTSKELGNSYQGLGVTVPMTWTFQQ